MVNSSRDFLFASLDDKTIPKEVFSKEKVSHSLIAVGAVGLRVPLHLGHSKRNVEPIPLLSLPYPSLIRKGASLLLCWQSFPVVGWRSPASVSGPSGITTRLRRLSAYFFYSFLKGRIANRKICRNVYISWIYGRIEK